MSRLRVAVDARTLQSDPLGGVGRWLNCVLPHLAEHVDLCLLLDGRRRVAGRVPDGVEPVRLRAPLPMPGLGWLEVSAAPWLRRFGGLFHAHFNTAPLSFTGPLILTLHDLSPQLHPEDFGSLTRAAWRLYVRRSTARARVITTVSDFVKGQITEYFDVDASRIHVVPSALDPIFKADRVADVEPLLRRLGVSPPYVVAVGGAPRRGLPVAIEAWRQARRRLDQPVTLVVVGTRALPAEPGLVLAGFLDDEAWATLLAGARALCYPTRYEGFGLPPLEAMASGTPPVCAPVSALPEVLGDAACWAAAPSAEPIAEVLARVLSDDEFHRERRAAGLERARLSTSYPEVAQRLLRAYEQAAA